MFHVVQGRAATGGGRGRWTVYGRDLANTHNAAGEKDIGPANVGSLDVKWTFTTSGILPATPAVDNSAVYFPDGGGTLYKLDAETGAPLWTRSIAALTARPTPSRARAPRSTVTCCTLAPRPGRTCSPWTAAPAPSCERRSSTRTRRRSSRSLPSCTAAACTWASPRARERKATTADCRASGAGQSGEQRPSNAQKDPRDWKTGDEPMTGAQASYLQTLFQEAGVEFDPNVTKAEASKRIDELQAKTGRGQQQRE